MTWTKLDDQWDLHPKVQALPEAAVLLWVRSITYCNRMLTDGFVPAGAVHLLTSAPDVTPLVTSLVTTVPEGYAAGLWETADGGYRVHDFLDFNPSRAEVIAKRRADAARQAKHRTSRHLSQRDNMRESRCDNPAPDPDPDPVPDPRSDPGSEGARTDRPAGASAVPTKPIQESLILEPEPRKRKPKAKQAADGNPAHMELIAHYSQAFEAANGRKPAIGSRGGKAANDLLRVCGGDLERAKGYVTRCYEPGSYWRDKASLAMLVGDPDKYGKGAEQRANVQPARPGHSWKPIQIEELSR